MKPWNNLVGSSRDRRGVPLGHGLRRRRRPRPGLGRQGGQRRRPAAARRRPPAAAAPAVPRMAHRGRGKPLAAARAPHRPPRQARGSRKPTEGQTARSTSEMLAMATAPSGRRQSARPAAADRSAGARNPALPVRAPPGGSAPGAGWTARRAVPAAAMPG